MDWAYSLHARISDLLLESHMIPPNCWEQPSGIELKITSVWSNNKNNKNNEKERLSCVCWYFLYISNEYDTSLFLELFQDILTFGGIAGNTWKCSGLSSNSKLRNFSWQYLEDLMGCLEIKPKTATHIVIHLLNILFYQPYTDISYWIYNVTFRSGF